MYKTANLAQGTLVAGTNSSSNTFILEADQGDLFPDVYPQLALVQEYEDSDLENKPFIKAEIVKITNKSGDTFTADRSAGYCPASSTATTQTNTAFTFNAGASFRLVTASEIIEEIQASLADKLGNDELRTGMSGTRKALYTDGSGNEQVVALGTAGKALISQGPTSAPIFDSPVSDINALTEQNTALDNDDYIQYFDGINNRKRLAKSSTTQEGLTRQLTDAEAKAGSDAGYVSGEQMIEEVTLRPGLIVAGTTYTASSYASTVNFTDAGYTKKYEGTILRAGTYRYSVDLSGNTGTTAYCRIYKNGVAFGIEHTKANSGASTVGGDLAFAAGDLIQMYVKQAGGGSCSIANYTVKYDMSFGTYTFVTA